MVAEEVVFSNKTIHCEIDHLVITASSLPAGAEYIRQTLGVTPQVGGQHPRMSTHNCLLRLGDATYLEVIAADPAAPSPNRPRWFGLDTLEKDAPPRLTTWVARVDDLDAAAAAVSVPLGRIESMSRAQFNWRI